MSTEAAKSKSTGAKQTSAPTRGQQRMPDGTVRVWSELGVTLPIGETTAHIRFSFGHERIAKSTQADIDRAEALVDEFNEKVLDKRVKKHVRTINRILNEADRPSKKGAKKKKSVRDRARERGR